MPTMFLLPHSNFRCVSPAERVIDHFFNDARHEMRHFDRPYWLAPQENPLSFAKGVGNVTDDKDKFAVSVNVEHFAPNEIKVTTSGRELVIEGKHEEKSDERGLIQRHFVRKFALPKEVQVEQVISYLSKDGVLTVSAPKNALEGPLVRSIPILPAPETNKSVEEKEKE